MNEQLLQGLSNELLFYICELFILFSLFHFFKKVGLRLFLICLTCFVALTAIDIIYAVSGKIASIYLFKGIIHLGIICFCVLGNFFIERVKYKRRKFTYV